MSWGPFAKGPLRAESVIAQNRPDHDDWYNGQVRPTHFPPKTRPANENQRLLLVLIFSIETYYIVAGSNYFIKHYIDAWSAFDKPNGIICKSVPFRPPVEDDDGNCSSEMPFI